MALSWLLERKALEMALRLGGALSLFWLMHEYQSEGQRWLEKALVDSGAVVAPVRAKALFVAGRMAYYRNDFNHAALYSEESLRLYRALEAQSLREGIPGGTTFKRGIAIALSSLAYLAISKGDYGAARILCDESLPLLREIGDRWRIAEALFLSAFERYSQGDDVRARAECEESLALCRELGERNGTAQLLLALGYFAYHQHDYTTAYSLYKESLGISRELGYKWLIASGLVGLGEVVATQGQLMWTARLWGAAEALREISGVNATSDRGYPAAHFKVYEQALMAARAQLVGQLAMA
jgi:tetratricopeptide (TPR) repeat protein